MVYRGYSGSIHESRDGGYHGRVEGVADSDYSGMTIESLEGAFRATVDAHIRKVNRKKKLILAPIGLVVALVVAGAVSCPGEAKHKEALNSVIKQGLAVSTSGMDESLSGFGVLAQLFGGGIASYAIDNMLVVENHVIFSKGTITTEGKTKILSIGVLGHVFTTISKEDVAALFSD